MSVSVLFIIIKRGEDNSTGNMVVYLNNGLLLWKKKRDWITDTCNSMDKPQKHHHGWKKPDTEGCPVWLPENGWAQGLYRDKKKLSRGNERVIAGLVPQLYTFTKTHWTEHLIWILLYINYCTVKTEENELLYLHMVLNCFLFYGSLVSHKYS